MDCDFFLKSQSVFASRNVWTNQNANFCVLIGLYGDSRQNKSIFWFVQQILIMKQSKHNTHRFRCKTNNPYKSSFLSLLRQCRMKPTELMLTEQYINNDSKEFCRCLCIDKVLGFWFIILQNLALWLAISFWNRKLCSHQEMSEPIKTRIFSFLLVCTAIAVRTNQFFDLFSRYYL